MDRELMQSAQQFHIRRRQRSAWKKLVSVLGCIVVFCTTYALILPAITMEREANCGLREHQHSESCYSRQEGKRMVCSATDIGVHTHSAGCSDGICGYADIMLHEHTVSCYNGSGSLVCTLPEVKAHTHTDACYRIPTREEPGHTHTGDCYTYEMRLSCGKTETEGHTHTDGCRQQKQVLCCGKPDHSHGTGCYGDDGTLTCSVEEHHHADACYQTETVLACGKEESEPHRHTDACYAEEKTLICTEKEGPIVKQGAPELICGKLQLQPHKHTASCFTAEGNWICGKPEVLSHTHQNTCFIATEENVLTCGLEEHIHTQACFAEATETTEEATEATEEATEATEEATEETEEEQTMPAQSFQGLTKSNVVVLADADAGAFPAGTTMYTSDVAVATARKLAEETADEDAEILDAVGVSIIFRNAEGTIIEPENGALVRVNIVLPEEKKLGGDNFSLLHRHNDGTVETVEMAEVNSDGAEFDAESFSIYVVTAMGDKHKSEVHANRNDGYYLNGPNRTASAFRPYVLALGDSVTIYADFDEPKKCTPFFFYADKNSSEGVYVDANNNTDIIEVSQSYTEISPGKYRTTAIITAHNLNKVKDKERQGSVEQYANPFNDEHFSLFAIYFGWPDNNLRCNLSESFPNIGNDAPTDENKENVKNAFFVRFVDKVFVESIAGSTELFVDYYDHADLEIDNSGYFTGKHTTYYLDRTEVETTTYSAAVKKVNRCTLRYENNTTVPVYYCTEKTGNATLYDVCNHGDDAYTNATAYDFISTERYVDNGTAIGSTQYEYTSKFGHQRFSRSAYSALFNFDLLLSPSKRDVSTTILATGQTTTLNDQSAEGLPSLTSTGVTAEMNHQSFVDAYNFCPDHSGLDFHISGNIGASITLDFDPVSVYLGAKKQLVGKALNAGEFSFVLTDTNGNVLQTVSNDEGGIIRFAPLSFSQAGKYYYTISEVQPQPGIPGVIYDNSTVNVRIEVTGSSAESNMAAKIYYNDTAYSSMNSLPVFTNRYATGSLIIHKTVVGKAVDPNESYSLTIRRVDGENLQNRDAIQLHSNKRENISFAGQDSYIWTDIRGDETLTFEGLPIGEYSVQEWGAHGATVTYFSKGESNGQSFSPPPDMVEYGYYAGAVTVTADGVTQEIINTFTQLAVTKKVTGNSAPADSTPYTVTVTSEGSVEWDKVQASSSNPDRTVSLTVDNGVSFTLVKDETVTLAGLPAGTYKVEETTPDSVESITYSPDGGFITTVADSNQATEVVITNNYPNRYRLPDTGGGGTARYTLGGFTMAAGAVLWLCYRRKRRREDG